MLRFNSSYYPILPFEMKNFSLAGPTLAEHLSRDFTICGIFRLFSWIGPLYSRIDFFLRPIVGQMRSFDLGDLSRRQRQSLANLAGSSEIMLGSFRMLDFEFPPRRGLRCSIFTALSMLVTLYNISEEILRRETADIPMQI